ncbi:MAG TPA: hypothetical protein DD490_16165 [Acidobacteria bacterium]|nr:hypothetical protein [Acidobacteriota bacterium]
MILETRAMAEGNEHTPDLDPSLRELLLHDVYDVPEAVFEEIDATVAVLCCPQCWETGITLETIPHKPGCALAKTAVS